jgi:hypothetical protein
VDLVVKERITHVTSIPTHEDVLDEKGQKVPVVVGVVVGVGGVGVGGVGGVGVGGVVVLVEDHGRRQWMEEVCC